MLAMVAPAAAHSVIVLPGASQAQSVNATANNFYYNVGDTANLYLYIIHPSESNFAEIAETFNMTQQVIYPNGTIAPVGLTRSSGNVSYDLGNDTFVTANWYSSNIKLDQEGVYYIYSAQKGYDDSGAQTRERGSVTVLYAGNSSTGWDNLKKSGLQTGAPVLLYPATDARGVQAGTSVNFTFAGNMSFFAQEVEDAKDVLDPLPVEAAIYTTPSQMKANGAGIHTLLHVKSNSNPTFSAGVTAAGVWTFMGVNQEGEIGDDNYQAVYVMPVLAASSGGNDNGNGSGNDSGSTEDGDSSIPGVGVIGLIACIGIAGALFMRRK
ncbi:hypothetical protein [Methanimicrococcus hacksteinii]|nr:hypothetical protein [Methanimicrococcus sp. At1]